MEGLTKKETNLIVEMLESRIKTMEGMRESTQSDIEYCGLMVILNKPKMSVSKFKHIYGSELASEGKTDPLFDDFMHFDKEVEKYSSLLFKLRELVKEVT